MNYQTILFQKEEKTAFICFNRPERLNAVNELFYQEMNHALTQLEADSQVHVVLLRGQGRAFCVGADLKDHSSKQRSPEEQRSYAQKEQQLCLQIQESSKLFVAGIHGYALGAGAEIALSCDFVLMTETAEIGFPELRLGTYLGGGITYTLPRLVGMTNARKLLFLGERISGQTAFQMGLLHQVVPESQLSDVSNALVQKLASLAPVSVRFAKAHLKNHFASTSVVALQQETEALFYCMQTDDWKEGIRAFLEKRSPHFQGK